MCHPSKLQDLGHTWGCCGPNVAFVVMTASITDSHYYLQPDGLLGNLTLLFKVKASV